MLSRQIFKRCFASGQGKRVGFIGLGNMGNPMTKNLVKNGYTVKGFDLDADKLKAAGENGVLAASSLADASKNVDYVVTCLPRSKNVEKVLY